MKINRYQSAEDVVSHFNKIRRDSHQNPRLSRTLQLNKGIARTSLKTPVGQLRTKPLPTFFNEEPEQGIARTSLNVKPIGQLCTKSFPPVLKEEPEQVENVGHPSLSTNIRQKHKTNEEDYTWIRLRNAFANRSPIRNLQSPQPEPFETKVESSDNHVQDIPENEIEDNTFQCEDCRHDLKYEKYFKEESSGNESDSESSHNECSYASHKKKHLKNDGSKHEKTLEDTCSEENNTCFSLSKEEDIKQLNSSTDNCVSVNNDEEVENPPETKNNGITTKLNNNKSVLLTAKMWFFLLILICASISLYIFTSKNAYDNLRHIYFYVREVPPQEPSFFQKCVNYLFFAFDGPKISSIFMYIF